MVMRLLSDGTISNNNNFGLRMDPRGTPTLVKYLRVFFDEKKIGKVLGLEIDPHDTRRSTLSLDISIEK